VRLHLDHRRSGLQVYVKMQSIELTPESPQLLEGEWNLEGNTLSERVVASSLYFFDVDNVAGLRVSFH